ncbi:DNA polymerase III subunit beta [Kamptonema cortianum]|nr:DNA polymerase III subunit beta [Geitlerinema splendidum]MDK3155995.1 DNA polymerase III subunit beta [Kamptonema cortianum]
MKATVSRKDLAGALGIAAQASSVRTSLPILASIRIEAGESGLTLLGCDGEMWARSSCQANVEDAGVVCVSQKLLSDIVNALPDGEVDMSHEGTQLYLRHGHSEWKMMAYPGDDFPEIPATQPASHLNLSASQLRRAINAVAYAVSDDTSRPVLTGVLFTYDGEVLTMVATDTHRMAVNKIVKSGIGSSVTAIVPEKALRIIRSLDLQDDEEVSLGFDEARVSVDIGSAQVVSQLLSGQYPNWERVVPSEYTRTWTMDRVELFDNIKRAMILARDNANRIKFTGAGDKVVISARSEDKGEAKEEVSILSKNGDVDIAFNGRYVMEALQALEGEGIRAEMTESSRPAVLRPTESADETFCVVMPMAIS